VVTQRFVPVVSLLALCACATLQLACALRRGLFHPTAVMLLVAAGILVVAALRARGRVDARWLLAPIAVIVVHGLLCWVPLPNSPHNPTMVRLVPALLAAVSLTYLLPVSRAIAHARFALVLLLAVGLALNLFDASKRPPIDVFDLQTQGADELLHGHDPYATVSVTDTNDPRASVPYTYMPVTLLATTLSRAATGDIRWAMLAALVLGALCVRQARRDAPDLLRDAAALILIGGPLTGFVLEEAWVDLIPLGLLCGAAWAFTSQRRTAAAVLFGLAFAGKQPLVIGFPLLLLLPGMGRRELGIAAGVAAATVLPFFAWSPSAFWHGTVSYFAHLPARPDALTLTNLIDLRFQHKPSEVYGLAVAVLIVALAWKRVPRTIGSFLLLACVALLAIFLTGRIAFANYYFLLAGIAAAAAALQYEPASDENAVPSIGEQPPARV
jgi:hypothetical protein